MARTYKDRDKGHWWNAHIVPPKLRTSFTSNNAKHWVQDNNGSWVWKNSTNGYKPRELNPLWHNFEQPWGMGTGPATPSSTPFGNKQACIGWERILDGWISQYWHAQQDQVWSQIWSWKSSLRWMAALIQKLWDISWDMWEHWNKELHSRGPDQKQILHSTVDSQIAAAYARGTQQQPWDALLSITANGNSPTIPLRIKTIVVGIHSSSPTVLPAPWVWKISWQTMVHDHMAPNNSST